MTEGRNVADGQIKSFEPHLNSLFTTMDRYSASITVDTTLIHLSGFSLYIPHTTWIHILELLHLGEELFPDLEWAFHPFPEKLYLWNICFITLKWHYHVFMFWQPLTIADTGNSLLRWVGEFFHLNHRNDNGREEDKVKEQYSECCLI